MSLALWTLLACAPWKKQLAEGDDWMARDNPGAAARAYAKGIDDNPEEPLLHLRMAQALIADAEFQRATEHGAIAIEAGLEGAEAVQAEAWLGIGAPDKAIDLLKPLATSGDPHVGWLMAEAELLRGDLTAAHHWLRESSDDSEDPRLWGAYAYVAARQGDTAPAAAAALASKDWFEAPTSAHADIGAAWLVAGEAANARAQATETIALDPNVNLEDGARAQWRTAAWQAAQQQRWEAAIRQGLRAGVIHMDDAELCWQLGAWHAATDDWDPAILWLERALQTSPYDAPEQVAATSSVSAVAGSTGMSAEERNAIRREITTLLAQAYRRTGNAEKEIESLELYMAAAGTLEPPVLYRMALVLNELSRPRDAAVVAMEAARRGHDPAASLAAKSFFASGDIENAIGWALQAWEFAPGDPELAILLARIYAADKRMDAALDILDASLVSHPDDRRLERLRTEIIEGSR